MTKGPRANREQGKEIQEVWRRFFIFHQTVAWVSECFIFRAIESYREVQAVKSMHHERTHSGKWFLLLTPESMGGGEFAVIQPCKRGWGCLCTKLVFMNFVLHLVRVGH